MPTLLVFPRDDALRAHVDDALERLGPCTHEVREAELRRTYPDLTVRPRSDGGSIGNDRTWYLFRDGSVRPTPAPDWWLEPGLPSFLIGEDGVYLGANEAAESLVGVPVERIRGARIGSFTRHEDTDTAGLRAFDRLARRGMLESTAVVLRADGKSRGVDYYIERRAAGGYTMVMRERAPG